MKGRTVALLLALLLLLPMNALGETGLYVKKVDNLPEDFIFGMDISSVIAEENSGVKYYGFDGQEQDLLKILADSGITHIRVRVWNHPYDAQGRGFGGGNCDIETALAIGKRAAKYGLRLIVDFHYSDFWADPGKQMVPLAWKDMNMEEKTEALYQFTKESLALLRDGGVDVAMVQVGNETTSGLCGETDWGRITRLMKAGIRAVRETCPDALTALHFTDPQNTGNYAWYAQTLADYGVDYDVFASSYYPYWHGDLDNLAAVLSQVAETYGKRVIVMETSWAYTGEDSDFSGNTISDESAVEKNYPYSVQGQVNSLRDIADTLANRTKNAIGMVYWEGAWITVGGASRKENSKLWEQYGSGWASSYASAYDPNDAGQYYGGSAVDNQAFFDPSGHPLESLKVFKLMRSGYGEPAETEQPEEAKTTGGEEMPVNYLLDPSFENGGEGWVFHDLRHSDQLYVEDKKNDSLTGTKHAHFWSAAQNSVEFTLEQQVDGLPEGKFSFSISIMGGDAGEYEAYAFVKIDGETAATAPLKITSWKNWDTGIIPEFYHPANADVVVGVYVKCQGAGAGAWGKIDDAMLTFVR